MRARNTNREQIDSYQRILDELDALGDGAGEEIFQTSASPFGDDQDLPENEAIDYAEDEGFAATLSTTRYQLQMLLPIEQEVRPTTYMPPQLMEDLVEHFRQVMAKIPQTMHPIIDLERWEIEQSAFINYLWKSKVCHFPDELLRRLRPHLPGRWDPDSRLAKFLIEQTVCKPYGIPFSKIQVDANDNHYRFKHLKDIENNLVASIGMIMVSAYLQRLSIKIAAWLPYELMVVMTESQFSDRVQSAFIAGDRYDQYFRRTHIETFSDKYWHTCLRHVLEWCEHRKWYHPFSSADGELHHDLFWYAIDEGTDEWKYTPDGDADGYFTMVRQRGRFI